MENLENKTLIELREMAKELGIEKYTTYNKADLINLILEKQEQDEFADALEPMEMDEVELEEADMEENDAYDEDIKFIFMNNVSSQEVTYKASTPLSKVLEDLHVPRSNTVTIDGEVLSFNSLERSIGNLGITNGKTIFSVTKTANA